MENVRRAIEKARQQDTGPPNHRAVNGGFGDMSLSSTAEMAEEGINICKEPLEKQRVIAGFPDHPVADSFRILRTQVLKSLPERGTSALAITSARRGEGKTLIAANLAVSLSMHVNRTALLVELDLRDPDVARKFSIQPTYGLSDYLLDDVPIADCICHPGIERLSLLPGGTPQNRSSELLTMPKMQALVHELESRYADRIVIYDLPPLLAGDDALAFLNQVKACLLVVAEGSTPRRDLVRTINLIGPERLIGTVLNKSSDTQHDTYYHAFERE